jgi:hypothetical protein
MTLIIESTTKIVECNGIPCRIWEGMTSSGIPCHAYITRVAVAEDLPGAAYAEFEQQLAEQRKPSPEIEAIPLRLIL